MPVWKKAFQLLLRVYELTKVYPAEEKYGLVSDMRRASNSVTNNISEAEKNELTTGYTEVIDNLDSMIKSKPMRVFTFITYLTNHIPKKYFRVIRTYGLFSKRLRGKLLPLTRKALKQNNSINPLFKSWRERTKNREKKDPLICEDCNIEMVLVFVCFTYKHEMTKKSGLKVDEVMPSRRIKMDTS